MSKGFTGDVSRVDDLLGAEGFDIERRVVRAQQPGRLPDVGGSEPRTGPIAHAAVERDPDNGDVRARDLIDAWQASKGRRTGEAWDLAGVDRTDDAPARHAREEVIDQG